MASFCKLQANATRGARSRTLPLRSTRLLLPLLVLSLSSDMARRACVAVRQGYELNTIGRARLTEHWLQDRLRMINSADEGASLLQMRGRLRCIVPTGKNSPKKSARPFRSELEHSRNATKLHRPLLVVPRRPTGERCPY